MNRAGKHTGLPSKFCAAGHKMGHMYRIVYMVHEG